MPTNSANLKDKIQLFKGKLASGKSPVFLFHGITLPYSYFEEILIFAPIQQEAKHDQEKLSVN